jgi:hypothetical protein
MSVEVLGPPIGYVDLLNHVTQEKIDKDRTDGNEFQKTPIRPSAAGKCTRELFYELLEFHGRAKFERETITPEVHRIFAMGHSVEYHVLKQFEMLKGVFDIRYKQQVLSFEFLKADKDDKLSQWLEGSLDVVFWSDKWKCVADVKSKKDKWSGAFKSDWDKSSEKLSKMETVHQISESSYWINDLAAFLAELNDPFLAANFLQLNLYANSEFLRERGIDHGAVLQYNKNDSRLRELRFRPHRGVYEQTLGKFQTAIKGVDGNQAPPRDYALGSVKCAFCSFRGECWQGNDAKKEFFNTFSPKEWPQKTANLGGLGKTLDTQIEDFEKYDSLSAGRDSAEARVVKTLVDAGVRKVQTREGRVYEAVSYKTGGVGGGPRIALKRSKA